MQAIEVEGYGAYLDYLEVHPEEFRFLFDTILINVTGFFRDPTAWELIRGGDRSPTGRLEAARGADPALVRRLRLGRGGV